MPALYYSAELERTLAAAIQALDLRTQLATATELATAAATDGLQEERADVAALQGSVEQKRKELLELQKSMAPLLGGDGGGAQLSPTEDGDHGTDKVSSAAPFRASS